MKYLGITPIEKMGDIWVKREDLAHWESLDYPSGSKVRQYLDMASRSVRDNQYPPCLVGCSANSCQQIYVAAAAKQLNTKGIIYTAKRKIRTEATTYCADLGAEIVEVRPAYLSFVRKQAHQRAIDEKHVIEWNSKTAILDTAQQYEEIPEGVKRIVIPTGSGLTATGVLIGWLNKFYSPIKTRDFITLDELDEYVPKTGMPEIIVVATSPMATKEKIIKSAKGLSQSKWTPDITIIRSEIPYDIPVVARLPDGTPLDPFYSAKAFKYLKPGDLFWIPGLRPVRSMPIECQKAFKYWKGPQ